MHYKKAVFMKNVYIVQWLSTNDINASHDANVFVWDNEVSALIDACDSILDHIDFFMSGDNDRNFVENIKDLIKNQKYYEAIGEFNNYKDLYCFDDERIFVKILCLKVHSKNKGVSRAHPMANLDPKGYIVISDVPGSTCRKCGEVNDYANSDRFDGTYVCYGCKFL